MTKTHLSLPHEGYCPTLIWSGNSRCMHCVPRMFSDYYTDILLAADGAEVTLLGLLDLSAAFDTVDHTILLDRLRVSFGLRGGVLSWITSFICDRTKTVVFNQERSRTVQVISGVPQGSVLGPLLFLLYTADVLLITRRHGLKAHSYADDIQIHCSGKAVSAAIVISRVVACINDIGEWMTGNRLKLNTDKTQFIWHGTRFQLSKVNIDKIELDGVSIPTSTTVRCLGVMLDGELSFAEHIKQLSNGCFISCDNSGPFVRLLTKESAKTLVHATVLSRVDYCNSVLNRVCAVHLRPLHSGRIALGCTSCSAGTEVRSYIDSDSWWSSLAACRPKD